MKSKKSTLSGEERRESNPHFAYVFRRAARTLPLSYVLMFARLSGQSSVSFPLCHRRPSFRAARQRNRAFGRLSRPQLQHHGLRGFVHSVSKTHRSPPTHDTWRRESCARALTQNMDRVAGLEPASCSVVTGFPLTSLRNRPNGKTPPSSLLFFL